MKYLIPLLVLATLPVLNRLAGEETVSSTSTETTTVTTVVTTTTTTTTMVTGSGTASAANPSPPSDEVQASLGGESELLDPGLISKQSGWREILITKSESKKPPTTSL